jgi:hypothetical protein
MPLAGANAIAPQAGDRRDVRPELANFRCRTQNREIVRTAGVHLHRPGGQRRGEPAGGINEVAGLGGEVHDVVVTGPLRRERAAQRLEHDAGAAGFQPLHHHRGARKGGMTTQRDLNGGREAAKPIAVPVPHQEGGLGEVALRGDRLEHCVGRKASEDHDGSEVAGKPAVSERIDLEDRHMH